MEFTKSPWNPDPRVIDDIIQKSGSETGSIRVDAKAYTPREILQEVRDGTPFGREFYQQHCNLMETMETLKKLQK